MDHNDTLENLGITLRSGTCILEKSEKNRLIGISIGGGAPRCPCVYVMQVFQGSLAEEDGSLSAGDEIVSINGESVNGKTKNEVANIIQSSTPNVTIHYNKIDGLKKDRNSLDIILKKMKHRLVESISSSTADTLGLSRAILCKDDMIKKLEELQKTGEFFCGLFLRIRSMMKRIQRLVAIHRSFGMTFANIGARDPHLEASSAYTTFGEIHRKLEKFGYDLLNTLKPILISFHTFLTKIIPDVRLTIERYADAKFEYLSYCLKVKEMDDEEVEYARLDEPLTRVRLGNYEYRIILIFRQMARKFFSQMRSDVFEKLELVDQRKVQGLVDHFNTFLSAFEKYHNSCLETMGNAHLFPIEINLKVEYPTKMEDNDEKEDDEHILTVNNNDS